MRRVTINAFVTLDGVMQAPGGPEEDPNGGFTHGGWSVNYWDEAMGERMDEVMGEPFDLLLGRRTYEIFAAHWPHVDDSNAKALNGATKYVATRTLGDLEWQNSTVVRDVPEDIERIKAEDGHEIQVHGSANLIQSLLREDLVDGIRLWIFPLVLGSGKRIFEDGGMPSGFQLTDSWTSSTGVLVATYKRAEMQPPGSMALEEPTEAEVARREKLAAES